jgi:hypothetical protein
MKVFGPAGIWNEFVSLAKGYIGTQVWCESEAERQYRVLDFWTSHRLCKRFREQLAAEYEWFSRLVTAEGLVERQEIVGTYYESSEGDDLAPAES